MSDNQDNIVKNTASEQYYRVEIIGNMSVYKDLLKRSAEHKTMRYFSTIEDTLGVGSSGGRMGDAIWPEENFICITYCTKQDLDILTKVVLELKQLFLHEGIKMFAVPLTGAIIH